VVVTGQKGNVMSGAQLYDTIGATYTVTRRTEPRIAARIWAALGDARTVLNVGAAKSLFTGALVTGPKTVTYQVPALSAGTYYFRCDVHPTQMFGTFVVK